MPKHRYGHKRNSHIYVMIWDTRHAWSWWWVPSEKTWRCPANDDFDFKVSSSNCRTFYTTKAARRHIRSLAIDKKFDTCKLILCRFYGGGKNRRFYEDSLPAIKDGTKI